jgi:methyl-galactoside transport system substrate-binding protein
MKRLPIVLVAFALLASSCAQIDRTKPRIGLAMRSFEDADSATIRGTIETAALDRAELAIIDGQNQQSAQDKQITSLLAKDLKAIAIEPIDGFSLGPTIDEAKAKKVPVVFFGLDPSDELMRSWDKLFFVGTGRAEAGEAQGEILAAFWKATPAADRDKDGVMRFVALTAAPAGQDSGSQADAAAKALGAAGIRTAMLASEGAGADSGTARLKMTSLLAKYGEKIEAVLCDDDDEALGAIEALRAAGYFKGRRHMPVVGAEGGELPQAVVAALASGSLLGVAQTNAAGQGKAVFDLAYALARGGSARRSGWKIIDAKYIWVPCRKITKDSLPAAASK